ncbi:MAG: hypothetical protein ACFFA6_15025 [Promethearchaeota archaeon]
MKDFLGELVRIPNPLFHSKKKDEIVCQYCKYKLVKPYPEDQLCPKCRKFLPDLYEFVKEYKEEPKPFETKTVTASIRLQGKVRVKPKNEVRVDLESDLIELTKGEYVKLLGITSIDRTQLYCSNKRYEYLLELTNNLDSIATSILEKNSNLDKMVLISEEKNEKEKCQFYERDKIIYLVYGKFPDKKGKWILEKMATNFNELVGERNVDELNNFEKYELKKDFQPRTKSILNEYVNLQEVFGDEDLGYVEDTIRIDYLGLSSMSIGVISILLGDENLNIEAPGVYDDPNEELEMKESMLTAKIEAIAANTQGNTGAIPRWIAVKLGFQKYRFLTFKKYQNDYFLNLISEGNLEKIADVEKILDIEIKRLADTPFSGNLQPFNALKTKLKKHFNIRRKFPPFNFNN